MEKVLNEMKSLKFLGAVPRIECRTVFEGILTAGVMNKINEIMFKNGFRYHYAHYSSEWENFTHFRTGTGKIFVSVHYFGNGKPVYQWGFLRT